jgi:hypothetical protein
MISSVFVSGRLGEVIDKHCRYVEVDRVVPGETGHYATDRFVVKSPMSSGSFIKAADGSYICFKGRLEMDAKLGLVIVNEMDEIFPLANKN